MSQKMSTERIAGLALGAALLFAVLWTAGTGGRGVSDLGGDDGALQARIERLEAELESLADAAPEMPEAPELPEDLNARIEALEAEVAEAAANAEKALADAAAAVERQAEAASEAAVDAAESVVTPDEGETEPEMPAAEETVEMTEPAEPDTTEQQTAADAAPADDAAEETAAAEEAPAEDAAETAAAEEAPAEETAGAEGGLSDATPVDALLAALPGDPDAGERVFRKCSACHMVGDDARNRVGPMLNDVLFRQAAVIEDFRYSKAMEAKGEEGLVWTPEVLFEYLEKPRDYVKGTSMSFAGLRKEEDRHDVIAYLATFE